MTMLSWAVWAGVVLLLSGILTVNCARSPIGASNGVAIAMGGILLLLICTLGAAFGRDLGQWETQDPAIVEWYQGLMQPDVPAASCYGEADAYFCDDVHVRDGKTFCAITDDRPDEPRRRPHIDIGTLIEIPPNKLKWDRGNPTGHGVVFLSRARYVFCYVQPGGV